jgi:hypothetical protein
LTQFSVDSKQSFVRTVCPRDSAAGTAIPFNKLECLIVG